LSQAPSPDPEAYIPVKQLAHESQPGGISRYVVTDPAAHCRHALAPAAGWYVPFWHGTGVSVAPGHALPMGHGVAHPAWSAIVSSL
jgi:hypothetical protein